MPNRVKLKIIASVPSDGNFPVALKRNLAKRNDHHGVILEVEWEGYCCVPQVEKLVSVYHKTDVLGLQNFLREKYGTWASSGSSVEEIWNNFKEIVSECIKRFVPHKILRKNPDPEYYSKEVKRLKIRKANNRRKLGEHHLQELKQISKQLLAARFPPPKKKTAQETFFRSILSKEGKCWPEFYKYVKRRKGYRENIPAIKD
jgi:hypothetical protein